MRRFLPLLSLPLLATAPLACGGGTPDAKTPVAKPASSTVFDQVVPSVVAVLNDDREDLELERQLALKEMGIESPKAPKQVVDVSLRKEPTPHGTGFMIEGGLVVTSAHVVLSPDRLKITTRSGKQVAAEVVHIDEVRDVAILKPKQALPEVPPLALADGDPQVGEKVWALGHTGGGMWALSWGISEGIGSGVVDLLGAKVFLYDAAVYPGFSGGPVVQLDASGKPRVVGVNHAILFTGGIVQTGQISSASVVSDIRDVLAGKPPVMQPALAEFAKKQLTKPRAQLFVTSNLSVHKGKDLLTTAAIMGNHKVVEAVDGVARVPVVAMFFGMPGGKTELEFELLDPDDKHVATIHKSVTLGPKERVGFATADFLFDPEWDGRYDVVAKVGGKPIGTTSLWIEDPEDDDQAIDEDDDSADPTEDGAPKVDVVVATLGKEDPLALLGIKSAWSEWKYPRRVGFTWFARGSRGWAGTNVAINAWVLDEKGSIVGRGVGCIRPELRPEQTWSCMGQGGAPLVRKEGRYDVVFTLNDKPVSVWPMEAMLRPDDPKSAFEKWSKDLKKKKQPKPAKPAAPKEPKPDGKPVTKTPTGPGKSGAAKVAVEGDMAPAAPKAIGPGKAGAVEKK